MKKSHVIKELHKQSFTDVFEEKETNITLPIRNQASNLGDNISWPEWVDFMVGTDKISHLYQL